MIRFASFPSVQVLCETCELIASHGPSDAPCVLVSLEPFCPGSLARLCLTVNSNLLQLAALALFRVAEDAVRRHGCMVIHTVSVQEFTLSGVAVQTFPATKKLMGVSSTALGEKR